MRTSGSTFAAMAANEISARDLAEHPDAIRRRVLSGERLTVVVDGQPVAELAAPAQRWTPKEVVLARHAEKRERPVDDRLWNDVQALRDPVDETEERLRRWG